MSDEPNVKLQKQQFQEKLFKSEKFEKVEHKEKPEKHEHKEKPEKFEHKEKPEKHEHKEIEKLHFKSEIPEKVIFEGNPKDIVEGNPTLPGDPIEQRLAALEQGMASMQHFITTEQRPDLSRGALAGEAGAKKTGG